MTQRHETKGMLNACFMSEKSILSCIEDYLYNQNTYEKKLNLINDLKRFLLKKNEVDDFVAEIYDTQFSNAPIDTSLITTQIISRDFIDEVDTLKYEFFDNRYKELQNIKLKDLDDLLESFVPKNPKGLHYIGKDNQLRKFKETLEKEEFIEKMSFQEFSKFFQEEFYPNDIKIHWKTNLNELHHLFRLFKEKKNELKYNRRNFTSIIPLMFTFKDENGKITAVSEQQYSGNSETVSNRTKRVLTEICKILTLDSEQ